MSATMLYTIRSDKQQRQQKHSLQSIYMRLHIHMYIRAYVGEEVYV